MSINEIVNAVSDYLNQIKDFIIGIADLFKTFCEFIPSPFKEILLSVLVIFIILLVLRSVGK